MTSTASTSKPRCSPISSRKGRGRKPTRALYAARELFLIWQDQTAALDFAPTVEWSDTLGAEQLNVDAATLADVCREFLADAQAFGTGAPMLGAAQMEDGRIDFELRERKDAPVEPANWSRAPFALLWISRASQECGRNR